MRIVIFLLCCVFLCPALASADVVNNDVATQIKLLTAIQKGQADQLAGTKVVEQQLAQIAVLLQQQLQQQQYQSKVMQQDSQAARAQQPQMLPRTQ
jgi:hypothetical protein